MNHRIFGPTGSLAIDDSGQGDIPVLFLHSLAGNSTHWSRQLEHLRPGRRAVALDLRGHGRSEAPRNGDYTVSGMIGDVEATMEALRLQQCILVGHSLGGGVALAYAGAHPERVPGLFLVDPIGDGTQTRPEEVTPFLESLEADYDSTIQGYWSQIAGPDNVVKERLLSDLRATPREAVVEGLKAVFQFDPKPSLARYRGAVLSIITPYNLEPSSLHLLGKGFPHQLVQDTGHWIHLDKPDIVNQMLDEFLKESVNGTRTSVSGKQE